MLLERFPDSRSHIMPKRILIYRLGSIGDTVVALPAIRLIARAFPNAEIRILTVFPNGAKVATIETIIGPLELIHGYFRYPLKTRDPRTLVCLVREIRKWRPDVLVYCAAPRGQFSVLRDVLFFKACGIRCLIGVPWSTQLQRSRKKENSDMWEPESHRLLRCLATLGDGRMDDPTVWDIELTGAERVKADNVLVAWPGRRGFICASIGTKAWVKDWGEDRWSECFRRFSHDKPEVGLVMVGSFDEYEQSERVGAAWKGPMLNVCGKLSPRETAAIIERAIFFVGHDSGPMHLAAAVGTSCIAVFSARNLPGEWYPFGASHRIFYHKTSCFGCRLVHTCPHDKMCIRAISVDEILTGLHDVWAVSWSSKTGQ